MNKQEQCTQAGVWEGGCEVCALLLTGIDLTHCVKSLENGDPSVCLSVFIGGFTVCVSVCARFLMYMYLFVYYIRWCIYVDLCI